MISRDTRRKRFIPFVFVAVAVVAVLLFSRHQPVDVEASYILGDRRAGAQELSVTWESKDGISVESTFPFGGGDVPRIQHHTLSVPPDTYKVRATLLMRDKTARLSETTVVVERAMNVDIPVGR